MYFGSVVTIRYMICKYFLLFQSLPFHYDDCLLCCVVAFQSDEISFVYLCVYLLKKSLYHCKATTKNFFQINKYVEIFF